MHKEIKGEELFVEVKERMKRRKRRKKDEEERCIVFHQSKPQKKFFGKEKRGVLKKNIELYVARITIVICSLHR